MFVNHNVAGGKAITVLVDPKQNIVKETDDLLESESARNSVL